MKIEELSKDEIIYVNLEMTKNELNQVLDHIINLYRNSFNYEEKDEKGYFDIFKKAIMTKSPSNEFEEFIQLLNKILTEKQI